MKTISTLLLAALICGSQTFADVIFTRYPPPPPPELTFEQRVESRLMPLRVSFRPAIQWREINGIKYNAGAKNWVQFVGRIDRFETNGVMMTGWFGNPMTWPASAVRDKIIVTSWNDPNSESIPVPMMRAFFVRDFSPPLLVGEHITWEMRCTAYPVGISTNRSERVYTLEHGNASTPPPPPVIKRKPVPVKTNATPPVPKPEP